MPNSTDLETRWLESTVAGFSALGDPIRLRILRVLEEGLRCVCELQERIDVAPNLLSYHLKVLRQAGLVEATRRGRWIDYGLCESGLRAVCRAVPGGE